MAVDYTKVFTMWGQYLLNVNEWYDLIAGEANGDQDDIEDELAAQDLIRLGDGLDSVFDSLKNNLSRFVEQLNRRIEDVLKDEELIGANFPFGATVNMQTLWPLLIHDMVLGDKNVTASVATIGAPGYTTVNAAVGKLVTGNKLDGISPPMLGATPIPDYSGLTTQLTPDNETITFTCIQDSEGGAQRGGETFMVTGTHARSGPYSPDGESVGTLGSMQVADVSAPGVISNPNFDSWSGTPESPVGWQVTSGVAGTDFEKSAVTLYGQGFSFKTIGAASSSELQQVLSNSVFLRKRGFFLTAWARKVVDTLGDASVFLSLLHDGGGLATLTINPISTTWTHFATQYIIPGEIEGDLVLRLTAAIDNETDDHVIIDQIVITPCTYHAGVAFAIFGGTEKFLVGDTISCALSNNNAGLFQESARKAFKVQLPTDGTPTISDALVG